MAHIPCPPSGIAVFSGRLPLTALFFLRRGYCHCLALVSHDNYSLIIESSLTKLTVHTYPDAYFFNIKKFLQKEGYLIRSVPSPTSRHSFRIPIIFTCVALVKKTLGISTYGIITPYALFRYLSKIARTQ